jgi:hypothetical protein
LLRPGIKPDLVNQEAVGEAQKAAIGLGLDCSAAVAVAMDALHAAQESLALRRVKL